MPRMFDRWFNKSAKLDEADLIIGRSIEGMKLQAEAHQASWGFGKLDRLRRGLVVQGGDRVRCAALGHHVTCAALAASALGGHAELELDFVEAHARACVACDLAVRNPAANTDDHGSRQW